MRFVYSGILSVALTLLFIGLGGKIQSIKRLSDLNAEKMHSQVPTVFIKKQGDKYVLYRHGKPYFIKGAGGYSNLEVLAEHGGNSLRTWDTQNAQEILDRAHDLGLTVTLGLEVGSQWWRDDIDYTNPKEVDKKIEEIKNIVLKYKNHPALLMWGVGNEVHLFQGNDTGLWVTINRIAKMIHQVDPNHPTMTALSIKTFREKHEMIKFKLICTNIDVLAVNPFGEIETVFADIYNSTFGMKTWDGPFLISEWGTDGPWETPRTSWRVPIEPNSTEMAEKIIRYYQNTIQKDSGRCIGSYAFYLGERYERTHTFFSLMNAAGDKTPSMNALQYLWTGKYPDNLAPVVHGVQIGQKASDTGYILCAGKMYNASVLASDPDQDTLYYQWEIRKEGLSNNRAALYNYPLEGSILHPDDIKTAFTAPLEEGAYRLMVHIYDHKKHVTHANIPVYVLSECTNGFDLHHIDR